MKLAIIGSRDLQDYNLLCQALAPIADQITCVVSGGAKGADTLAEDWARANNKPVQIFLAEWDKFGKAAGMIRNKDIVSNSDLVYAFWDGKSPGTKNSINLCKELEVPCKVVIFAPNKTTIPNRLKSKL